MIENNRKLTIGTWISAGAPVITEVIASLGFDWLLFDLEHGCMTGAGIISNLQATGKYPTKIIVRVGEAKPSLIARLLDWGATGIMLPNIRTAKEVKEVVNSMYYPPKGNRGFSSSARTFEYGNTPVKNTVDYSPILIVQIENNDGLSQVDEIARINEVDVLFVGPSDLKLNLSYQKGDSIINYNTALEKVMNEAKKNGKQAGILIKDKKDFASMRTMGFSCIAMGSDISIIRSGYKELLSLT